MTYMGVHQIVIILAVFFFVHCELISQHLSAELGLNYSIVVDVSEMAEITNNTRITVGINFDMRLNDYLSIGTGLKYSCSHAE